MTYYWLYGRLNVHVGVTDSNLMAALDDYANEHVTGGAGALTQAHRDGIRREHRDARDLYSAVATGRF